MDDQAVLLLILFEWRYIYEVLLRISDFIRRFYGDNAH